ncbi:uncharacterized protein LOC144366004 [Ictidomys tridecemlineatus]
MSTARFPRATPGRFQRIELLGTRLPSLRPDAELDWLKERLRTPSKLGRGVVGRARERVQRARQAERSGATLTHALGGGPPARAGRPQAARSLPAAGQSEAPSPRPPRKRRREMRTSGKSQRSAAAATRSRRQNGGGGGGGLVLRGEPGPRHPCDGPRRPAAAHRPLSPPCATWDTRGPWDVLRPPRLLPSGPWPLSRSPALPCRVNYFNFKEL